MASNPTSPTTPAVTTPSVPLTFIVTARPDSAPARAMAITQARPTLMPAVRAAAGLAPAVSSRKPSTVRLSSHQMKATTSRATMNPRCTRRLVPGNSRG